MKSLSICIALAALLATASVAAAAGVTPAGAAKPAAAGPDCKAIFKQYPVSKCRRDALCPQRNAESRLARKNAGCPVSRHQN